MSSSVSESYNCLLNRTNSCSKENVQNYFFSAVSTCSSGDKHSHYQEKRARGTSKRVPPHYRSPTRGQILIFTLDSFMCLLLLPRYCEIKKSDSYTLTRCNSVIRCPNYAVFLMYERDFSSYYGQCTHQCTNLANLWRPFQ